MKIKRLIIAIPIIMLAIVACSLGTPSSAGSAGSQTLTALAQSAATNSTPAATSTGIPLVNVDDVTGCRAGPGDAYDNLATVSVGVQATAVGKDASGAYLLVELPTGETCWLSESYTSWAGDRSTLPEITPPPSPTPSSTPTPSPPAAPTNLTGVKNCSTVSGPGITPTTHFNIQLSWTDAADNETDYFVQYNNQSISLPANSSSYTLDVDVPPGTSLQVQVLVQNDTGQTSSDILTYTCP